MSSFKDSTGKSIQEAFELFHSLNPKVYELFKKSSFEAIRAGKKKISSKTICGKIKWDMFIQTEEPTLFNDGGKLVKFCINDAYSSRLARLFAKDFPEHEDIFNYKSLRA